MVWDDIDGKPGNLIYEDGKDHTAVYSDALNKYVRFKFDQAVSISGKFYVGILQYREFLLNIGVDVSKTNSGDILYNEGIGWEQSEVPGTLMFRPFVLRNYSLTDETNISKPGHIKIWPNPADDYIRLEPQDFLLEGTTIINIFDISGKLYRTSNKFIEEMYIGDLPEGFYFISFSSSNRLLKTEKLLIRR